MTETTPTFFFRFKAARFINLYRDVTLYSFKGPFIPETLYKKKAS